MATGQFRGHWRGRGGKARRPTDQTQTYDFVERPSEEYFCPVTFEMLLEPRQTACCGHHLSHEAATQLQREGKPCPLCKEPNLATVEDKFFKRKVKELKVRCPRKVNGCKWVGEMGSVDQHDKTCPKRPWECVYCQKRGVYEIREGHMPNCTQYPTPCPNNCDVGAVARCKLDEHIAVCPLQVVKCEFSHAGCKAVGQRREIARHLEEGAQQHLLSATLLNLTLTREMRAEMQEKMDEMEGRINKMETQLWKKMKEVEEKVQKVEGSLQRELKWNAEEKARKMTQLHGEITQLRGETTQLHGKLLEQISDIKVSMVTKRGTFDFTVEDKQMTSQGQFHSTSDRVVMPFLENHQLQLDLEVANNIGPQPQRSYYMGQQCHYMQQPGVYEEQPVNCCRYEEQPGDYCRYEEQPKVAKIGHVGVWLNVTLQQKESIKPLQRGCHIKVTGRLTLLNQLGNHGHKSVDFNMDDLVISEASQYTCKVCISPSFIASYSLTQCRTPSNPGVYCTQYLSANDCCLCFRLHIHVGLVPQ